MAKRSPPVKRCRIGYGSAMSESGRKSEQQIRAERLAAALRANLRKRKGLGGSADPGKDQHPTAQPEKD
ncbi:hypothetical protein [Sandarakinorhabdus oryzae]|uniref:hypothetical protein n=1 Tax=Sandarakinorhabdus oryzae TaxID=2675220 RepID=UPI0012E23DDF|nr:hypothetical protein [Sandarakinorhabdus oryzae]